MVLLQRNLYFSKDPEGVQHLPGGSSFQGAGVGRAFQILISIEPHLTCDFPGGGGGGGGGEGRFNFLYVFHTEFRRYSFNFSKLCLR